MADLFNLSFTTGVFPSVLKTAKVVPVFKKDSKSPCYQILKKYLNNLCIRDYIHFSITILSITYSLDWDNNILYSTTANIRKALDDEKIGCGVFIDLQKAFDTVDHQILLAKLNHYGIHGVSNDWFKSYLSTRNQYVSKNGVDSGLAAINCSVHQGSVLGPLLFSLYINELYQAIKFCKIHHFADDTNLLCLRNSIKKLNNLVNTDLKYLVNWLNANKI